MDYDSIALPTELSSQPKGVNKNGSGSRTRTCDRVVNSHLLYRLSYAGASMMKLIYPGSAKNQACFEEKTEKTGYLPFVPFEKVNARGGIGEGCESGYRKAGHGLSA